MNDKSPAIIHEFNNIVKNGCVKYFNVPGYTRQKYYAEPASANYSPLMKN